MNRMTPVALALALAMSAGAAGASAQSGLSGEREINQGLFVLAVADKIRRACDGISARFFRAHGYTNDLKEMARARGYSREEVEDYLNDETEKAKMRARRNAYFEANGASNLDPESLCTLGRAEIARNSQIGHLLRAK
ncbi:DUF5333 domain-containing protein [Roseovarius salis]|uniref:DUF5333 domain-containing protein n=1 Tax=Roseovarius salis TaxID=3376063 RepID=UPI0037C6CD90